MNFVPINLRAESGFSFGKKMQGAARQRRRGGRMKRREFISLVVTVAAMPLAARAQQGERPKRIGILSEISEDQMQPMVAAFRRQLQQLGWSGEIGRASCRERGR